MTIGASPERSKMVKHEAFRQTSVQRNRGGLSCGYISPTRTRRSLRLVSVSAGYRLRHREAPYPSLLMYSVQYSPNARSSARRLP